MHHTPERDNHLKVVFDWEKNNAEGLTTDEQLMLFAKAIKAIEVRTLRTLSDVTLYVILDRVVKQASEKFSVLLLVKVEQKGIDFTEFFSHKKDESQELLEGLRYLVAEILTVLGSITAEILSDSLHKELLQVTWKKNERRIDDVYPIN